MITNLRKSKKSSFGQAFLSIFLVFLVLGMLGFLAFTNWKITQKRVEFQKKIEVLKKEIQVLEERNANLKAGISKTRSEDYQVERLYEQGYFEEGAVPVVVLPPEEKATQEKEEKTPWNTQAWWEWLKNRLRQ